MAKISLYDIFTGSATTKWLEPDTGISLEYSADDHSVIIGLTGTGPGGTIDISLDPNPTLGGDLNLNGHSIISNPGQDIRIQPGAGGDLILNGLEFPNQDGNAGDLLGTDGNGHLVWYTVPGISNSQPGLTYYVDQSVAVSGDGSKELPFKTITEALGVANNTDTIVVYAGAYAELLTITKNLYMIAIDDADVTVFGNVTIMATKSLKATGIKFENNVDEAITNDGQLIIDGGSITRDDVNGVTNNGVMVIKNALIKTHITSTNSIELTNTDSDGGLITTSGSLVIYSAVKAPMIDHLQGRMEVRNAPLFDYDDTGASIGSLNSIRSSATTGSFLLDNVSFKQTTGWSKIDKTGSCSWVINNVGRDSQVDVLQGTRSYFITEASDLSSYYTPSNYLIPNNVTEKRGVREASITDHLIGIDAVLGFAISSPDHVVWVSLDGSNTYNGSYGKPYATLTYAISQAQAGDTIVIADGSYTGETIVVDKNLYIKGFGEATFLNSTMEISNNARLLMDHINIMSSGVALSVDTGSFRITNSYFESPTNAIEINELSGDSELIDSNWSNRLVNADTTGHKLLIRGVNSPDAGIIANGVGSITTIRDSAVIGHVDHQAGKLSIINVGQVVSDGSDQSITSTADNTGNNFLYLNLVSTKQDDGSYGKVNKTGNSDYQLGINDLGTNNTFNGNGDVGTILSDQVDVTYTPESYTPDSISLTDHIKKIDELLGQAVIRPTRLYYVDDVDELNDVYMGITETTFGFDSTIYITPGAIAQFMLHDNFEFKPGINLIGTGASENVIVQMPITIPNLVMTSALSGMVHETLWRDIKLNSPTIVDLTLAGDEVHFEDMTINGDITVNSGRLIIRNSKLNGVITVAGGILEIWSSELEENIIVGSGSLYINGFQHVIDNASPSFNVSGGTVMIHNYNGSNASQPIFTITGGKTTVTTLIVDQSTSTEVINQSIGGTIYIGANNIDAEGKTITGTEIYSLGFGI